jgi:hypothetical protein
MTSVTCMQRFVSCVRFAILCVLFLGVRTVTAARVQQSSATNSTIDDSFTVGTAPWQPKLCCLCRVPIVEKCVKSRRQKLTLNTIYETLSKLGPCFILSVKIINHFPSCIWHNWTTLYNNIILYIVRDKNSYLLCKHSFIRKTDNSRMHACKYLLPLCT